MNIKGTTFSDVVKRLSNIPIAEAGQIVRTELIQVTKNKGWKRFKSAIKLRKESKEKCAIYVDDNQQKNTGAKNNEVAAYLHSGTDKHKVAPVNKKALFWKGKVVVSKGMSAKMKTKGFFSKGHEVSGIKATYWFTLSENIRNKVNKFISDHISKVKNG